MPDRGNCRSCDAPIVWAKTAANRRMPVDPDPHPAGNIRFVSDDLIDILGKKAANEARISGADLHRSHFATCSNADGHRKSR